VVAVAGLVLGLGAPSASATAAVDQHNVTVPVTSIVPAVGGCGETVYLSGWALVRYLSVTDGSGGVHIDEFAFNLQGVTGVGETTGDSYRVVFVEQGGPFHSTSGGESNFTLVQRARVITSGPANNSTFDGIMHATVDANGSLHFFFEFLSGGCDNG